MIGLSVMIDRCVVPPRGSMHITPLVSMSSAGGYSPSDPRDSRDPDLDIVKLVLLASAVVFVVAGAIWLTRRGYGRGFPGRPPAGPLRRGGPLPDFVAADEQGDPVRSTELVGSPTVLLFVRGSWCPFCTAQVADLTRYYKDIVDLGGKLILVTPKPLETTRRVAEFFEVEFDFWLDESLAVAKRLELVHTAGVPEAYLGEYGADTVWPTALVVDAAGIVRYVGLSKRIVDRPDPRTLLKELRKTMVASQ